MTNSIKISPQRTSFILSVSVILYWATDSYLYLSCHINLMEYSTPVILYITAMILACGVLQRFFFRFITKNELSLSFGKQVRPLPEQIKEIDPECPKDKDINLGNLVVKHDYMIMKCVSPKLNVKKQKGRQTLSVSFMNIPHL